MFRSSGNPLRRAGASVSEIALSRFINHNVFETKLGDLGMLLSLVGIDPDCRTDEMLNALHADSNRPSGSSTIGSACTRTLSKVLAPRRLRRRAIPRARRKKSCAGAWMRWGHGALAL
jgi:hypothetical protein